jgi:hypothetical protein
MKENDSHAATTLSKCLQGARTTLGISVSTLSKILGVPRLTIFSLLTAEKLMANTVIAPQKIEMLNLLCSKIERADLPIPCNRILQRRDEEGRRLNDLLEAGCLTPEELDTFVSIEIEHHHQNRQRIKTAFQNISKEKNSDPERLSAAFYLE